MVIYYSIFYLYRYICFLSVLIFGKEWRGSSDPDVSARPQDDFKVNDEWESCIHRTHLHILIKLKRSHVGAYSVKTEAKLIYTSSSSTQTNSEISSKINRT